MILYHGSFGKDAPDYDLVVGGVANDKVFNTVELFFDGWIDKAEAIKRLRYEKPNVQICFRTERALSLLHFEGSEIDVYKRQVYKHDIVKKKKQRNVHGAIS